MRRRLIALAVLTGAIGCASAQPPPGGAEDRLPPRLVSVTPEPRTVNFRDRTVVFQFDETINDRGTGAQEVGNYFLVSPTDGDPQVSWRRNRIDVRPRHGFRENTAYTVTLLPGLSDLRGNVSREGMSVVFSTGPTIPPGRINGIVFDWVAERPAPRALVEAFSRDSVVYVAQSDSAGNFTVGPLPTGTYLVRAIVDANNNRALDRNEAFDTASVTTYDTARVAVVPPAPLELLVASRDTLPPRILTVTLADSLSLRVTFDRFLDPAAPPPASAFHLVAADSSVVPILAVLAPRAEQAEILARQQATADSLRRVDSLAGKPLPPRRTLAEAARRPGALPTPSVPAPYTALLLRIARPLAPSSTYRLSVAGARALSGRVQGSERSFTTPRPPPPPPVRADSTSRVPARPAATPAPAPPTPTPRPTPPGP